MKQFPHLPQSRHVGEGLGRQLLTSWEGPPRLRMREQPVEAEHPHVASELVEQRKDELAACVSKVLLLGA